MKIPDTRSPYYDRGRSRSFKYFDESCPIVDKIFEELLGELTDAEFQTLTYNQIVRHVENTTNQIKDQVTYKFRDALVVALMEKLQLEEELDRYRAKFLWLRLKFEKLLKIAKERIGRACLAEASLNSNISLSTLEKLAETITQGATSVKNQAETLSVISSKENSQARKSLVENTFVKITGIMRQMIKTTVTSITSFIGLSEPKKGKTLNF